MYILIRNDNSKVLGYTVWSGFDSDGKITQSFNDVAVRSFEQNEKSASIRMFSTKEYAFSESIRISTLIKENTGQVIELDIMPLSVYINHIERWK
jgi:hypothetical protein